MKRPILALLVAAVAIGSAQAADISVSELTKSLFAATDGQPVDLTGKNFSGLDLSGLNFKKAKLPRQICSART